jgi:hypothetical protein
LLAVFAALFSAGCIPDCVQEFYDERSDREGFTGVPAPPSFEEADEKTSVELASGSLFGPNSDEFRALREAAREDVGGGLVLGERVEVARTSWGALSRIAWRSGQEFGFGWHIRFEPTAKLDVLGAETAVPFGELIGEALSEGGAAINGGFFDEEGRPLDLVRGGGEDIRRFRSRGGSGVFVVGDEGGNIIHRDEWPVDAFAALQSIDRIVADGESLVSERATGRQRRAARAAVVIADEAVEFVAVAHGESLRGGPEQIEVGFASGFGLTLHEFADYLVAASGADRALNLDGGPSVHLRFVGDDEHYSLDAGGPTPSAIVALPAD